MHTVGNRKALYYPYIHIRDENWLKGTLLAFPQLCRMVPPGFDLHDSAEADAFRELTGAHGERLLFEEDTSQEAVYDAGSRLQAKLQENLEELRERYSEQKSTEQGLRDAFQIHEGKLGEVLSWLESQGMAWDARGHASPDGYRWFAVHPKLGEAFMSTIAIALARSRGLDIVTDRSEIHHWLVTRNEDEAFDAILHGSPDPPEMTTEAVVHKVAHVALTTGFDLSRLGAAQIAELKKEGKDLQQFKSALVPIAQGVTDMTDPSALEAELKIAAQEAMETWQSYKGSLPSFARQALKETVADLAPDLGVEIIKGVVTAGVSVAGLGLRVIAGTVSRTVAKKQEAGQSPYQYLSRVVEQGAVLATAADREEGDPEGGG